MPRQAVDTAPVITDATDDDRVDALAALRDRIAELELELEEKAKTPAPPANDTIAAAREHRTYRDALAAALASTDFTDPSKRAAFIAEFGTGSLPPENVCPPQGEAGDKTEEVLVWLAQNRPNEFVNKYGGDGTNPPRGGDLIRKLLPQAKARCQTK